MKLSTFLFSFVFLFLVSISIVSVSALKVDIPFPVVAANDSTNAANDSEYFQGYTPITLYNNYKSLFDSVYCELDGCFPTGNILSSANISANYFIGNGSLLTGVIHDANDTLGDSFLVKIGTTIVGNMTAFDNRYMNGGYKSFYFTNHSSDVVGMYNTTLYLTDLHQQISSITQSAGDGDNLIAQFISPVEQDYIVASGTRKFTITASVDSVAKVVQLRGLIYRTNLNGENQVLLRNSTLSLPLGLSPAEYTMTSLGDVVLINSSERILFEIHAEKEAGGPNIATTIYVEDDTFSRLDVPSPVRVSIDTWSLNYTNYYNKTQIDNNFSNYWRSNDITEIDNFTTTGRIGIGGTVSSTDRIKLLTTKSDASGLYIDAATNAYNGTLDGGSITNTKKVDGNAWNQAQTLTTTAISNTLSNTKAMNTGQVMFPTNIGMRNEVTVQPSDTSDVYVLQETNYGNYNNVNRYGKITQGSPVMTSVYNYGTYNTVSDQFTSPNGATVNDYGIYNQIGTSGGTAKDTKNVYGVYTQIYASIGTVNSAAGERISVITNATNAYGILIEGVSGFGGSNWAFYNSGNTGDIYLGGNNIKTYFGNSKAVSMYYDGTNFIINPKEVGNGLLILKGNLNMTNYSIWNTGDILPYSTNSKTIGSSTLRYLKGWFSGIDVNGNINQTSGNSSINNFYAGMWFFNQSGTPLTLDGTYRKINNTYSNSNNGFIFHSNNTLELINPQGAGLYRIEWKSEGTGVQNHVYLGYSYINEVQQNNTVGHAIGQASSAIKFNGFGYIRLNQYDNVTIRLADTSGTSSGTAIDGNVLLERVGN